MSKVTLNITHNDDKEKRKKKNSDFFSKKHKSSLRKKKNSFFSNKKHTRKKKKAKKVKLKKAKKSTKQKLRKKRKDKGKKVRNKAKKKQSKIKKVIIGIIGLVIVGALSFGGFSVYKTFSALEESGVNINPKDTIIRTVTKKKPELIKDENSLTSVLAVGIDTRASNPGLQNTDSIIILTLNHKTNEVTMLSLPRDTWVQNPLNPNNYTKINSVYNICESYKEGSGMKCLQETAERITNLDIQYYGMIDIAGFVKTVDTIGGIEVDVENSFTDYMFPTPQNTYETISFQSGKQHMDGETAMKFARSRHAQSVEGSDFARARRQQKVIIAAKQKLLSTETLLDPKKILQLMDDLSNSIKVAKITTKEEHDTTAEDLQSITNPDEKTIAITDEDVQAGLNQLQKIDRGSIYSMVLDPTAGNWSLVAEDPSSAYILVPKAGVGNWSAVHNFVQSYINNPALHGEKAKVYVYNGGLGYTAANQEVIALTQKYPYLNITYGGNLAVQTYTGTQIYTFSPEKKFSTLNVLKDYFETEWSDEIPQGIANLYGEDIVVILGAPEAEPAPTNPTQTENTET
jgi:LCP family protein required for cell wall assembly